MKTIIRTAAGTLIPVFCLLFCGCYTYWKALFGVLIIASPFISHDMQSEDVEPGFTGTSGFWPVAIEESCEPDQSIGSCMQSGDGEYGCIEKPGSRPVTTGDAYETNESIIIIDPEPAYSWPDAACPDHEPACSADACPVNTDTEPPAVQTDSGGDSNERRDWNRR